MGQIEPLYPFQERSIEFGKGLDGVYYAIDMGLGKTRITLNWIAPFINEGVLVIAPLKAIYTTWPDEIKKWGFKYSYSIIHGPEKLQAMRKKANVYLINFEGLVFLFEQMKVLYKQTGQVMFRTLVIDEGSKIKSHSTKRFKVLKAMRPIFKKIAILSGTPSPQGLLGLWSQYFMLDGGDRLFSSVTKFKKEYFMPLDFRGFSWGIKSEFHEQKIYDKVKDITYRLDSGDYISLPPIKYIDIDLELPKPLLAKYKELEKTFFMELSESAELEVFNAAALSMKLRQFVQGAVYTEGRQYETLHTEKLDKLVEMVEEANGQGILCPIQFKFELDMIRKAFPKVPAIVGGVPMSVAGKHIRDWNNKEIPLLLCHPASLSHAVNMQDGSHIIVWYAIPWSSELYEQLNKRVHRNGQKHPVMIYHMRIKGSIDQRITAALASKIKDQRKFLDFIKSFHVNDL